jgi:recombination protein RecT
MSNDTAIVAVDEQEKAPLMELLKNPAIVRRFEMACGHQAGTVMLNIINAANANPEIFKCEPLSVVNAGLNAAALRLSTSPALGQSCILPFKKWRQINGSWVVESMNAQFVPMKRGIRDLAMRTNKYRVLNSFCVYEGQEWEENQMTGIGKPVGPIKDKKKVIGYGAYLLLFDGYEATDYMTREEMTEHVINFSPSWDKKKSEIRKGSKWDTDFDMMAEGVVLKRLIRNKGVISTDDRAKLDAIESGDAPQIEQVEDDIIEAEEMEISPEEQAYISACEVTDNQGQRYGDKEEKALTKIINAEAAPQEKRAAAQLILDWRKAKHDKNMQDLGY